MNASKSLLLLVILMACVTPALAVGKFYDNKIVPYDGVAEFNALPQNLYGTLSGHLRSSDNFLTPKVGIRNQADPNGTFTYFPILSDGRFGDLDGSIDIRLIPGKYDLYLPDGNGGQPEYSTALITAGKTSYPERELLGHAYSGEPEKEIIPGPDCHTHKTWIFEWGWVRHCYRGFCWWSFEITGGHWFEWQCCCDHRTTPN